VLLVTALGLVFGGAMVLGVLLARQAPPLGAVGPARADGLVDELDGPHDRGSDGRRGGIGGLRER
jgi:hypothetical protein